MNDFVITPKIQLLIFSLVCGLGFAGWLLLDVVFRVTPTTSQDYSRLVRVRVDPSLSTSAVEKMRQGSVIGSRELSKFNLYVLDTSGSSGNQLKIKLYTPPVPYNGGR